jgi:hypothetical protein
MESNELRCGCQKVLYFPPAILPNKRKGQHVALIPAYEAKLQQIQSTCKHGGFDLATGTFTPFKTWDDVYVHEVLDVITAAAEAGALDSEKWVSQIFATIEVFESFLDEYSEYDDCYRTYDRWYWAMFRLAGHDDEEGFVTSSEIAGKLREIAEETGQV